MGMSEDDGNVERKLKKSIMSPFLVETKNDIYGQSEQVGHEQLSCS